MDTDILNTKNRNKTIDTLKGIAIIFVIITHTITEPSLRNKLLFPFIIDCAVPLFLFISGYLYTQSFVKKLDENTKSYYKKENLGKKLLRILVPFSMIFLLEIIISIILSNNTMYSALSKYTNSIDLKAFVFDFESLKDVIFLYISGAKGPGSYYITIIVQLILIYPLLFKLIKRYKSNGLLIVFICNLAFEIIKYTTSLNIDIYRLLIFRYLFIISFGIYLYLYGKPSKMISFLFTVIGITFQICTSYLNINFIIFGQWASTSLFGCMLWIPIFCYLIEKDVLNNKYLEHLGEVSLDIFLSQMIYYYYLLNITCKFIDNNLFLVTIAIAVSCLLGLIFNRIEKPITESIMNKLVN